MELSRIVIVDKLPDAIVVEADAAECAALAERLRIVEVQSLTCRFSLRRHGNTVEAEGALDAAVLQSCVVTLDPVAQRVAERFVILFVPAGREPEDGDDPDSPDHIPYEGRSIDLGEAAAEQLALALDPYPRSPGAILDPAAQDPAEGGFAGLSILRPKK